jgi:hypothetical protein
MQITRSKPFKKFSEGDLKEGQSLEIKMELSSDDGSLSHTIKDKININ